MQKFFKRKSLIKCVIAACIIILLGSLVPLPLPVNKTLSGIKWRSGVPDYSESSKIMVHGTYLMYLIPIFKDNRFSGDIIVSGVAFSSEDHLCDFEFFRNMNKIGELYYWLGSSPSHSLGYIKQSHLFSEIVIWGYYDNPKTDIYANISFPAKTREEAVSLALSLYGDIYGFS
jgi:hypothetical protein